MKRLENNEIEILLKNLAKGERAKASSSVAQDSASEHLDADELSSFAEGRLPPVTRSSYMGHLADCDRCRSIVAQLAAASGVAGTTEPAPTRSRWIFITQFFSPGVMRYAMPTLAVVILAVAVFVWMQQQSATRIAQHENATSTAKVFDENSKAQPVEPGISAPESTRTSVANTAKTPEAKREKTDSDTTAKDGRAARSDETKSVDTPASTGGAAAATTPTPAPAAAKSAEAYAPPPPAKGEPEKEVTRTYDEAERKQRPAAAPSESAREEQAADKNKAAAKRSASGVASNSRLGVFNAAQNVASRNVGGKTFQRINDVWVDTAYNTSTPTTNINRGSEQYRALIGDEPGLKTIAEQLSGEVIVVWKGKAYRIR